MDKNIIIDMFYKARDAFYTDMESLADNQSVTETIDGTLSDVGFTDEEIDAIMDEDTSDVELMNKLIAYTIWDYNGGDTISDIRTALGELYDVYADKAYVKELLAMVRGLH